MSDHELTRRIKEASDLIQTLRGDCSTGTNVLLLQLEIVSWLLSGLCQKMDRLIDLVEDFQEDRSETS